MNHPSHRAVVVHPRVPLGHPLELMIDFKSPWMAKQIVAVYEKEGAQQLRDAMLQFVTRPQRSSFTSWFFEALAHRIIVSRGCIDDHDLRRMALYTDTKTAAFVVDWSGFTARAERSSRSEPSSVLPPWPKVEQTTPFDISCFPNTISYDTYYTPTSSCPLVDAFVVSRNADSIDAHLWILQMKLPRRYGGSSKDYALIRKILL
ncbi:hypothetical protein BD309DRAFT_921163 [Dichomitus squalens]|uniref:Uncharacterized protein n=1 Tax=Dichomitus squalens TaxID=114155 RepID=A0A4Q9PFS6_9APHY|nr:hypothetical protein BD309DRAFT_921163 [Dichomitus squalens]TBU53829.1 hypothetical protein BD310DRAFT_829335 [Dichomitus squalens]